MTQADIILMILVGGFALFGFWFGLIHTLGSFLGAILGSLVAGHFYTPVAQWLLSFRGGNENIVKVITFILLFVLASRLVGLLFMLIEKMFNLLKIIPFFSLINRLAGTILGFLEGVLVIGMSLLVISKFPLTISFTAALAQSVVASWLIRGSSVIWPLLPVAFRQLQTYF